VGALPTLFGATEIVLLGVAITFGFQLKMPNNANNYESLVLFPSMFVGGYNNFGDNYLHGESTRGFTGQSTNRLICIV